jgi:very-short-patch-repair endonuclease
MNNPTSRRNKQNRNIVIGQQVSSVKVQRAKELRREMTEEEKILWKHLRANRLNGLHFRRQQIIDGFIVDFYCHTAGVVVEVDGEIHEQQVEYDAERDKILSARGLLMLRFKNQEIRQELAKVLAQIAQICFEQT